MEVRVSCRGKPMTGSQPTVGAGGPWSLAAASHDLNQPLHAALLFHSVLQRRNRDPALADALDKLGQSLSSLQAMLDGLLGIARLDAGLERPELVSFPIAPLLDRLFDEFAAHAEAAGLELRMIGSRARIVSDPGMLERILRNLVGNAVRYTRRGGILIGCRSTATCLRIQVWDTGIGIAPEQISEIFDLYRRLESPRIGAQGLGIGLTIAGRLAQMLGHRIDVRSRPGLGSVFEIVVDRGDGATDPC
ncbi:MAG: hypothetical protein GC191_17915 [Azospirillum sp.]|nr:hypothetical protein [Azospirillum sp.]